MVLPSLVCETVPESILEGGGSFQQAVIFLVIKDQIENFHKAGDKTVIQTLHIHVNQSI